MHSRWLKQVIFWMLLPLLLAFSRWMAPPRSRAVQRGYDEEQVPEPLPTGVIGCAMWGLAIGFVLLFFVLKGANRWWASMDGASILTQYPTPAIWCFLPGFAALAIPWPLTVWYLRRVGRWEEANSIEDAADIKGRANQFQIMKWLSIGLVCPIALFTLPAIPIHLSIGDSAAKVAHYGSIHSELFPFKDARRLTVIEGYRLRDGSFRPAKDVLIDFADGRRLRGNAVGDGGTSVRNDVLRLLIAKTGLEPEHALTADDVPLFRPEH